MYLGSARPRVTVPRGAGRRDRVAVSAGNAAGVPGVAGRAAFLNPL